MSISKATKHIKRSKGQDQIHEARTTYKSSDFTLNLALIDDRASSLSTNTSTRCPYTEQPTELRSILIIASGDHEELFRWIQTAKKMSSHQIRIATDHIHRSLVLESGFEMYDCGGQVPETRKSDACLRSRWLHCTRGDGSDLRSWLCEACSRKRSRCWAGFAQTHAQTRSRKLRPFIADVVITGTYDPMRQHAIKAGQRLRVPVITLTVPEGIRKPKFTAPVRRASSDSQAPDQLGAWSVLRVLVSAVTRRVITRLWQPAQVGFEDSTQDNTAERSRMLAALISSTPLEVCRICPESIARWEHRDTGLRISGAVAAGLVAAQILEWEDLDHEPCSRVHTVQTSSRKLLSFIVLLCLQVLQLIALLGESFLGFDIRLRLRGPMFDDYCSRMRDPVRRAKIRQAEYDLFSRRTATRPSLCVWLSDEELAWRWKTAVTERENS